MDLKQQSSKPHKSTSSKIFSFLPKTATVTFTNPPFSPGREKHQHNSKLKAFSGPIISMIPDEARIRKSKNGRSNNFDTQEPTSPKVSCMGQIKQKKKECKSKCGLPKPTTTTTTTTTSSKNHHKHSTSDKPKLKSSLSFGNIFGKKQGRSKLDTRPIVGVSDAAAVPGLDQMKRYASGRDTFADFDWKAVAAERRNYYSDHEESDGEEEDEVDECFGPFGHGEVIIPHSAPLVMMGSGGKTTTTTTALEPRKEINLWKRRTTAPPRPLQINVRTKP